MLVILDDLHIWANVMHITPLHQKIDNFFLNCVAEHRIFEKDIHTHGPLLFFEHSSECPSCRADYFV